MGSYLLAPQEGNVQELSLRTWGLSEMTRVLPYVGGRSDEPAEGEALSLDGKEAK